MYNYPVRFDGDIIITDPCYIINSDNEVYVPDPDPRDYYSKVRMVGEYPVRPDESMYEDMVEIDPECIIDPYEKSVATTCKLITGSYMVSPTFRKENAAYFKAYSDCRALCNDDWDFCEYGDNMSILGFTNHLSDRTLYGDWSCTTFDRDTGEDIGKFCADSGMVGVFLLDEVLRYNPHYNNHIHKKWTTTWIKDFHGEVELVVNTDPEGEEYVEVIGRGNINFVGRQTGF